MDLGQVCECDIWLEVLRMGMLTDRLEDLCVSLTKANDQFMGVDVEPGDVMKNAAAHAIWLSKPDLPT